VYHQNPDLYYFSGYNEPDAVLLIFKETQYVVTAITMNYFLYANVTLKMKHGPAGDWHRGHSFKAWFDKVFTGEDFDSICPI